MKMKRSEKSDLLLHTPRVVVPDRPLHITSRVADDVPDLRRPEVFAAVRDLLAEARRRGVRTPVIVVMSTHVHWMAIPCSAKALHDVTRLFFSKLAKIVNRLCGRRGKVFVERYYSDVCINVRQSFHVLAYILRNAVTGGLRRRGETPDPYTLLDDETLANDRFLRLVLGPPGAARRALLAQMQEGPVPFVPLVERLQPTLPGL